jgi:hypothetical protein
MGYSIIPFRRIIVLLACIGLLFVYASYMPSAKAFTCEVTFAIVGSGTTSPSGSLIVFTGLGESELDIVATPDAGHSFSSWKSNPAGYVVFDNPNSASTKATISQDATAVTITATFTQNVYTVSVTVSPSAGGSVARSSDGPYHYGDVVTLTPTANTGYTFSSWSGAGTNGAGNTRVVTVTDNMAVIASFTQNEYEISVTISPGAGGSVSRSSPGPYHYDDVVTLTPIANAGYSFSGWSGAGTNGAGNTRVVTVTGNMAVTATFTQNVYTVSVTVSPSAGGSVARSSDGPYHYGDVVTLTPTANAGYTFAVWSGAGTNGDGNTRIITVAENVAVTATFTLNTYQVSFAAVGGSPGSTTTPSGSKTYNHGQTVSITATPAGGYRFSSWSKTGSITIANANSASATATISGAGTITANFAQIFYQVDFIMSGNGNINPPSGIKTYASGSVVAISAAPANTYSFASWSTTGSVTIADPDSAIASATINGDGTITANFIQNSYSLSIATIGSGSVSKNPNQASYHHGSSVTLEAMPVAGWSFSGWMGDLTGSTSPTTITMNKGMTIIANFAQDYYQVTFNTVGSGTITPSQDQSYASGSVISISAVPANGYVFSSWNVTGSIVIADKASASTSAKIDSSGSITATFSYLPPQSTTSPPANTTPIPTANPTSILLPEPTQEPISSPSINFQSKSIIATAADGSSTYITIYGDLNGSVISNAVIERDQEASKTTLSLTLIGQNGADSLYNVTIRKGIITSNSVPTVYVNNLVATSQGFVESENNFFVWYNTPQSAYDLSIVFADQNPNLLLWPIIIVIIISIVLVGVLVLPKLKASSKENSAFLGSRNGIDVSDYLISNDVLKLYSKKGIFLKKRIIVGEIPVSQITGSERFWDELIIKWNGITSTFYKRDDFKSFNELVEKVKIIVIENKSANEKKEKLSLRKIEVDKLINEIIPVIDVLFDLLRRLNGKRPDWARMIRQVSSIGQSQNLTTQILPSLFLDYSSLNSAVETYSPRRVASESYKLLKVINEYFEKLPPKDEFSEVHPNLQDITDVIKSYYTLNDVLLGKIINKKESPLENRSLERSLTKLATQSNFKINLEELRTYIGNIGVVDDDEDAINNARSLFKENMTEL